MGNLLAIMLGFMFAGIMFKIGGALGDIAAYFIRYLFMRVGKSPWKRLALQGPEYKIRAIKAYLDSFPENRRPDLQTSKNAVERYISKYYRRRS